MKTGKSFGAGSQSNINRIEKEFNIQLPQDYKAFLLKHNGFIADYGDYDKVLFSVPEINQEIPMDNFFGVDIEEYADIIKINKEYEDDLPENSLLIGADVGEGFILLILDGESSGIWYYDHTYFFPQSSDEINTFFICETFSEFIEMIEKSA